MKLAALLFLLICTYVLGSQRIYEDKIRKAIQDFAEKLRNEGFPEMNIPPLDPLFLEKLHLDINQPPIAVLNVNLSSVHERGITHFDIPNLAFRLVGMKLDYGFKWPEVFLSAGYSLKGVLGGTHPLTVSGNVSALIHGLAISGNGRLKTDEHKYVRVADFHIFFDLDKLVFKITGIGDKETSAKISSAISTAAPYLLKDSSVRSTIGNFLRPIVIEQANRLIGNRTIGDIIGGLGRDVIYEY